MTKVKSKPDDADRPTEDDVARERLGGSRGAAELKPAPMTRLRRSAPLLRRNLVVKHSGGPAEGVGWAAHPLLRRNLVVKARPVSSGIPDRGGFIVAQTDPTAALLR